MRQGLGALPPGEELDEITARFNEIEHNINRQKEQSAPGAPGF